MGNMANKFLEIQHKMNHYQILKNKKLTKMEIRVKELRKKKKLEKRNGKEFKRNTMMEKLLIEFMY